MAGAGARYGPRIKANARPAAPMRTPSTQASTTARRGGRVAQRGPGSVPTPGRSACSGTPARPHAAVSPQRPDASRLTRRPAAPRWGDARPAPAAPCASSLHAHAPQCGAATPNRSGAADARPARERSPPAPPAPAPRSARAAQALPSPIPPSLVRDDHDPGVFQCCLQPLTPVPEIDLHRAGPYPGSRTGSAVRSTTCRSTKLECTPVTPSMRVSRFSSRS